MWEIEKGVRGLDGFRDMLDEVGTIRTRKKFGGTPIEYLEQYCGYDTEVTSWREDPVTGLVYPQSHFIGLSRKERDDIHAATVVRACVYAWMIAVKGRAVCVRSWADIMECFRILVEFYGLNPNRRLKMPVQNLAYEFQFMKDRFRWLQVQETKFDPVKGKRVPAFDDGEPIMKSEVFSTKDRNVIRAVTADGIEFVDTLILSKANLEHMADGLRESLDWFNLEKLVNDMDYTKMRLPDTDLTEKELDYCGNDVKILAAYYWQKAQEDGDLTKIPMTDTGYVRAFTRKKALVLEEPVEKTSRTGRKYKDSRNHDFIRQIHGANMTVDTYRLAKEVFRGGHTHANAHHVGKILKDVASNDFTSSYPTQMISKPYPSTTPVRCDKIKSFNDVKRWSAAGYFVMFRCRIYGLDEKFTGEHILSESKCKIPNRPKKLKIDESSEFIVDNGRLVKCPELTTAMCDIDLRTFDSFYKWDREEVFDAYVSRYAYLPKPIIEAILHFYANKCLLKGSEDPEELVEYLKSKGMLNSSYGMQVMDIVRQYVKYTDDWNVENVSERSDEQMNLDLIEYNVDGQRFTFFLQGVACTAWSRDALLGGILAIGPEDYVYADTDSIKHLNHEKHLPYFEAYNKSITEQVNRVLDFYGIDRALACPVVDKKQKDGTVKKVAQPIGVWDYEGTYKAFMTWGAKRYLVIKWDKEKEKWKPEATVAGVNKRKYTEYLATCGKNPFKVFHPGKLVPHKACNRITTQYVDAMRVNGKKVGYRGTVTDCNGKECDYFEYSFVYMEPSDYMMTLGEFEEYVEAINH